MCLRWCSGRDWSVLSNFTELRHLHVHRWMQRDLEPLRSLRKLENLEIVGAFGCRDLSPLAELTHLKLLHLNGFTKVRDYSFLARLNRLDVLRVSDLWGPHAIRTAAPFAELHRLGMLELSGFRFQPGAIRALASLRRLKLLNLDYNCPWEDLAWLAGRLSTTNCDQFLPVTKVKDSQCLKCGATGLKLLKGARRRIVCTACDPRAAARRCAHPPFRGGA